MSINLCAIGHEEICYEGSICPFCKEITDRDAIEEELNERIKSLEANNESDL